MIALEFVIVDVSDVVGVFHCCWLAAVAVAYGAGIDHCYCSS